MEQDLSIVIVTIIKVVIIGVAANEIFKICNPRSNNTNDMKFVLLTPTSRVVWRFGCNMPSISAVFDPQKDTIILVHGFLTNADGEFPCIVKDAYLETYTNDVNIICVDWGQLAGRSPVDYSQVLERLGSVAICVACVLYRLVNTTGLDLANVHLIGHSLGAHICGRVGQEVQAHGRKLGLITGLDPAGPGFEGPGEHRPLQRVDAHFVQGIHTSSSLGTTMRVGHVDHFINGGMQQPNCTIRDIVGVGTCSHAEAYVIFAKAIRKRYLTFQYRP